MKNKKKLLLPLLLLVLLVAVGGTVAWLTSTSELTNNFTVGSFTEPTTDPTDPTTLLADEIEAGPGSLDGNLFEKSWDPEATHKLLPGVEFAKDPYVGIGPNSEDAVVYVYVDNNASNKVYFTINTGWEAVTGYTTPGYTPDGVQETRYTSGLFKYTAGLTASASADVWTTSPLFSKVTVDATAGANDGGETDFPQGNNTRIVVKSFLHQAKDSNGDSIDATTILNAAKTAFNLS